EEGDQPRVLPEAGDLDRGGSPSEGRDREGPRLPREGREGLGSGGLPRDARHGPGWHPLRDAGRARSSTGLRQGPVQVADPEGPPVAEAAPPPEGRAAARSPEAVRASER